MKKARDEVFVPFPPSSFIWRNVYLSAYLLPFPFPPWSSAGLAPKVKEEEEEECKMERGVRKTEEGKAEKERGGSHVGKSGRERLTVLLMHKGEEAR